MLYHGIPANSGKTSGKLCIVHSIDEFSHCDEGDVVLLVKVKPSVPLVKMSSALLAVHGGITSHAAIVARENNRPAIVGLPEEMLHQVKNGDFVEVNGDQGVVEVK